MKGNFIKFLDLPQLQDKIVFNHEVLKRGRLCKKDIDNLKRWRYLEIPMSESNQLTPEGYVEIFEQARRYKNRFPNILNRKFSSDIFQFQHTAHLKNRRTAIAFAEGIFGSKIVEENRMEVCPPAYDTDLLVKLYPDCKDDLLMDYDVNDTLKYKHIFETGSRMQQVIKDVSERLGFAEPLELNAIQNIYNICRYSKAWYYVELMPWCACFSAKDLKVFEYGNDLAYYYNSGPGLDINKRFGCPLLKDMINQFNAIKEEENGNRTLAKFYFGHSTTLFNLLAELGTHKQEEHIMVDNYEKMQNRMWQTSRIDPFGSNFVAVFLKCDTVNPYKVMFYQNEMNFKIKECQGFICDWDRFIDLYKKDIDSEMCGTDYCDEPVYINWDWLQANQNNTDVNDPKDKETEKVDPKIETEDQNRLDDQTYKMASPPKIQYTETADENVKNYPLKTTNSLKKDPSKTIKETNLTDKSFVNYNKGMPYSILSKFMTEVESKPNVLDTNYVELKIHFVTLTVFISIILLFAFKRVCGCRRKYRLLYV